MGGKRRRISFSQPTVVDPASVRGARQARRGGGANGVADSQVRSPLVPRGELGSGGQGKVMEAFDPNLGRVVAMKVLAPRLAKVPASVRRFVEEARVMAQLDHPNIIPIHDLVVEEGHAAHFAMKLVRGRTLDSLVHDRRSNTGESNAPPPGQTAPTAPGVTVDAGDAVEPATPSTGTGRAEARSPARASGSVAPPAQSLRELLMTFLKVCDALAFAHDRNIIHCDLKPDNIMVGEFGEAYLMDWGIASQLQADGPSLPPPSDLTGVRGTPDFMSPEQATGDPRGPTKRTDVFGLGAVLYFILTGQAPFAAKTTAQALARAKKCSYDDPETVAPAKPPLALARIVKKAMAADPNERFSSVLELREQVDQVIRGDWDLPTRTYPPGTVIVREGEWADAAYIIVNGSCLVWKTVGGQRRLLRTLGPGAVFGETSILSGDVRTATVETVGEVAVRVVTRELFQDQLGVDSWLAKFVLALADRFRELEQRSIPADGGDAEPRPRVR